MAKKVTLIEAHSDSVARYVKKTLAELMVRRLLWEWVKPGKIAKIKPLSSLPAKVQSVRLVVDRAYIPATLPLAEVEGCKFVAPKGSNTHPELLTRAYLWARASELHSVGS